MNSFTPHNSPVRSVLLLCHFSDRETEAQGGWNCLLMTIQLRRESQHLNPCLLGFCSLLPTTGCTAFPGKVNTGGGDSQSQGPELGVWPPARRPLWPPQSEPEREREEGREVLRAGGMGPHRAVGGPWLLLRAGRSHKGAPSRRGMSSDSGVHRAPLAACEEPRVGRGRMGDQRRAGRRLLGWTGPGWGRW